MAPLFLIIMPEYLYKNPETGETISLMQKMSDTHEFIDDNGLSWQRVFSQIGIGIDSQNVDPFSEKQFMEKTANMKGTIGDMMDYSKELSQQRESSRGKDPVKQKMFDNYKKETGTTHLKDKSVKKTFENKNVKVDY